MTRTVAALYISAEGPYPSMEGVDAWDIDRDGKRYDGPYPVVAHPPCGPYSRLAFLCEKQDPECALRAVDQVRAFGGVLEHPKDSKLWRVKRLPKPGELPDAWGGRSYALRQVAWGHCCEKPTWIYVVGIAPELVVSTMRSGGVATKAVTNGPRNDRGLLRATSREAIHSPPAFAEWLVSLARAVDLER